MPLPFAKSSPLPLASGARAARFSGAVIPVARQLRYVDALREAAAELLAHDPRVYVVGLGVPGPTGIFGSTLGLADRFGAERRARHAGLGECDDRVVLGSAIAGMRPILVHMRMDFAVLAMEPLVNQAAKWHYMYGGKMRAPITVRMIIGRGVGPRPAALAIAAGMVCTCSGPQGSHADHALRC